MDSHDAKLEELENLVKGQASLIDELKSKQVELTSALESKQVQLEAAIADSKVQAAKELSDVKVALEQSQETAKVNLAQQLDRVENRAKKSEERQVGLANLEKHLSDQKMTMTRSKEECQQFQQAWTSRVNAIDRLLASWEVVKVVLDYPLTLIYRIFVSVWFYEF